MRLIPDRFRSSDDDDGCGFHHFGKWKADIPKNHYDRVENCYKITALSGSMYNVKVKKYRTCQHEGCTAREEQWEMVAAVESYEEATESLADYISNE